MTAADAPEIGLLLEAARAGTDPVALRSAIERGPDWTAVTALALRHGIAGLLCQRVLDVAAELVPDDLGMAMRAYLDSCSERHAIAVAELLELLDALSSAGVTALPFKGPALAARIYADAALRPCADLDFLIREADIDAAFAVLEWLGFISQHPGLSPDDRQAYHRYNGQDCLTAPGWRMPIEPHWALAPRTLAITLDTAGLMVRASPVTIGDHQVMTLSADDTLLAAALHGSKEEWTRLSWIADIAALLTRGQQLHPADVLARATAAGARRMLLVGVALARDLLGAPCGGTFADAVADDAGSRRLAETVAARLWQRGEASSVFVLSQFRWRMRERLRDRVRYAAATLLTARVQHFQAVRLPRRLRLLYPLVRIGHDCIALPVWHLLRRRA